MDPFDARVTVIEATLTTLATKDDAAAVAGAVARLAEQIGAQDAQIEAPGGRNGSQDARLDKLDATFESIDKRLRAIEITLSAVSADLS